LIASLITVPGQTYLVEGVLPSQGVRQGTVRIVLTTRPSADILGETTLRPSDHQAGGIHFACLFDSGTRSGSFWITLECQDGQALSPPEIKLWHLTAAYAKSARLVDPRKVIEKLRAGLRQPYPMLARLPDEVRVYENPEARPMAGFVREVRPAANDVDAAERITSPGPPVRDLAYVVAPGGCSQDWDLSRPVHFEPGGHAGLYCRRPDDLTVYTINRGEGFLVLPVTRFLGWSATIDGKKATIHAVDGPFMGVRVPAGEHTIRFRFRPVLVWAGTTAAVLILGGAWVAVGIGSIRRRRGNLRAADSVEAAHGMAA
jgi:Bacterial membrane protein YfhO